jgi:hypothetical protein
MRSFSISTLHQMLSGCTKLSGQALRVRGGGEGSLVGILIWRWNILTESLIFLILSKSSLQITHHSALNKRSS